VAFIVITIALGLRVCPCTNRVVMKEVFPRSSSSNEIFHRK
jgi:hypothetical protein